MAALLLCNFPNKQCITVDNSSILLYTVYQEEDTYEDYNQQFINGTYIAGDLKENDALPSVRTLAKDLKISALTVKKAYDNLEQEGYTVTVHGKGTYVAAANTERMKEEQRREVETDLDNAVQKGRRCGLTDEEIRELFDLIMED